MMKLTQCKKASVYDLNHIFICDASVSNIEEASLTLLFDQPSADILRSEVYVTFYDRILGLATYYCQLSDYHEYLSAPNLRVSSTICTLNKEISIIQRRNDIKIPINIDTILTFTNEKDVIMNAAAVLRDLSAGGLFFTSRYPFRIGQIFSFSFLQSSPPFSLSAKIIRMQPPHEYSVALPETDDLFGFGCHFVDISPYTESIVRNFVYRQDLVAQKKRRMEPRK